MRESVADNGAGICDGPPAPVTTPSVGQFNYEDLDLSSEAVRLIKVLPARHNTGLLQLEISHHTLPTSYRCLSYRWSQRHTTHKLLINQCEFYVGQNLHDFLEQVRVWAEQGYNESLWIDAICINQARVDERGHQVQRMGTIYAGAQEVFIWLGDHGKLADAFHDWLHHGEHHNCPSALRDCWDRIRFHEYWRRAWIVQEILLAKKVTVVLPDAQVDWTIIGRAIAKAGNMDRLDQESAAHLWTFWAERWISRHPTSTRRSRWLHNGLPVNRLEMDSLWSLIHMHRHALCTDKRDRIYSLLGLIHAENDFKVDYNESIVDLFWRAGEHFNAWDAPELVDILRVALLQEAERECEDASATSPWRLMASLNARPDLCVRVPVRRVVAATSLRSRFTKAVKCRFPYCRKAPAFPCHRDDLLLCTNTEPDGPSSHGCIHGLCRRTDNGAFDITLTAHHDERTAEVTLPSKAVQVYKGDTEIWDGLTSWSQLKSVLKARDLDRADRVKLSVPARYAIWIWFGIHPGHMEQNPDLQRVDSRYDHRRSLPARRSETESRHNPILEQDEVYKIRASIS